MAKMTVAEREAFLAELHVGVIAIERPDRAPLAVPIWYGYEPGGEVVVWMDNGSVKEKLIRAAGRFALSVQVEQAPYRYATVEGQVIAIEPATLDTARPIAVRYLGEEEGTAYAANTLTGDSIIIRMKPERWLSADHSKD
ncbi:pyridoxamine 5'-phosphate oxidase family protein [Nocardia sp. NPDC059180]|uniref:pyridoxamine 5'-phosphate oxidase family protein n=1 Tax=Nocardia sp. NPDC059180 TaxID=3346761 RepID=UPI00367B153C